jgi:signal transduction histidine kinase
VSEFDCHALALEVLDQAREEAHRAGSALSLKVEGTTLGSWDRQRLGQALANLLANAIKYGRGGPIALELEGGAGGLRITCIDQGVGIEPSALEAIFRRFERAGASRNDGGLGLGLYVAREIARAHGGDIGVRSEPGRGSTFTLSLPRNARA